MRFAETSFSPASGRVIAIVVSLICVGGLVGFVVSADYGGLVRYGSAFLLAIALVFALFWLPEVRVATTGVTIRNVLRTFDVPWASIENFDTKFSLTITTGHRTISAWASPAPGRYAASTASPQDARIAGRGSASAAIRPGDLPTTSSGAAAYVIRRHLEDLRENGQLEIHTPPPPVTVTMHWATIIVLIVLTIVTVVGVAA